VPGLVLVTGPNGVGKTNLLEAVHVGVQGFSPRTRSDRQLVRFGEEAARVSLSGVRRALPVTTTVTIRPGEPKTVNLNGAPVANAEDLRHELAALAFTPDRLAVVKGGPIVRRTYLDRLLGRLAPALAELPSEYARALGQRNAGLRRARAGLSSRDALAPWTAQLARLGSELDAARAAAVAQLAPGFAVHGETLGLPSPALRYDERGLAPEELEARLERDLERGTTGAGPHLRDVDVLAGPRDLRAFGSQGEQRAAVLALVLAEAELLGTRRGEPPLLLLDDVLSELDRARRTALLAALPARGQTVVTSTSADALPPSAPAPALVVVVSPGEVRTA